MKKRGVVGILVVVIFLMSIVAVTARPPPPPPPSELLYMHMEKSDIPEEEKEEVMQNLTIEHHLTEEETEHFQDLVEEKVEPEAVKRAEAAAAGVDITDDSEFRASYTGQSTDLDFSIAGVVVDPTSSIAEIKVCNLGKPNGIIAENNLAISLMMAHKKDYIEIARWRPRIEFDSTQCYKAPVSMKALYHKHGLKIGDNMKLLVDADGLFLENNENNNAFLYNLGSERIKDGVYRVEGPVKESPLSPELTSIETSAIFEEGSCSNIDIAGMAHKVCLLSDNFLKSKLTIDGELDSIIHLWSWDWVKADIGGIKVSTTGEFFVFTA